MNLNTKFDIILTTLGAISFFIYLGIFALVFSGANSPNLLYCDYHILKWVGEGRADLLTAFMKLLSTLGGTIFLVSFSTVLILIPFLRKNIGLFVVPALALTSLINTALKHLIARPRPDIITHLVHESSYSFPSGHSICSTVFYLLLAFAVFTITKNTKNKATKNLLIALSLIFTILPFFIAFSRVYLGVHYPSDVLAGVFLGLSFVFARLLLLSIKKI